jgi:predicted RecA/RadA family phage recombinase
MKNSIQEKEPVTFIAPSGGVTSGTPVQIGQLLVVPIADAAQGDKFAGITSGVISYAKTSAQAWTEGALVYWDATPGEFTTTATGNLLVGVAYEAAVNPSSTGKVLLDGVARVQS